jgi:hypothetical protein
VHIFDPPNVVNRIDPDASTQRLAGNVPNVVTLILARIYTLVRVQQFDVKDSGVLASHRNRPGIRLGFTIGDLLGVIDRQPAHGTCSYSG